MYVATCPSCAATTSVSPASPSMMLCEHCGAQSPMPPEVARRLWAAGNLIRQLGAKGMTLTASQRRAITSGQWMTRLYLGVGALLMAPALLFAALGVLYCSPNAGNSAESAFWLVNTCTPALILLGAALLGAKALRRSQRRLRLAAAASPPRRENEVGRCRICDGPLSAAAGEAIVTCGYCRADNFIDPSLGPEVLKARQRDIQDLEGMIMGNVHSVESSAMWLSLALIVVALATPFLSITILVVTLIAAVFITTAPSETNRYRLTTVGEELCANRLYTRHQMTSSPAGQVVDARWFQGRWVRHTDSGGVTLSGRVESVNSNGLGQDNAVVRGRTVPVSGLCLPAAAPDPP